MNDCLEFEVEVPAADIISYNFNNLLSAFSDLPGLKDLSPACLTVETDGCRRAFVTVYRKPPLEHVRQARVEDLVMDERGFIRIGVSHDGRVVKDRLYVPGSAQRFALFGTTGAGKSRALQMKLIAQKRSGIVSFLGDLKSGQSAPEARGNVDWRTTGQESTLLMLLVACAIAKSRERRYSRMGRSGFKINDPDPLLIVWVDEANRALEDGAPYRKAMAHMIKELGRTGRSVGVSVGIAAQAGHVAELGGSDTLRAMLKEGSVTLLRSTSSMMSSLVSDGLLPPGLQLMPLPKFWGATTLRSRFEEYDEDEEDSETAGLAYLVGSRNPSRMMRHFMVGSTGETSGLDPKILELYGTDAPPTLNKQDVDAGGHFYQCRWDEDQAPGWFGEMVKLLDKGAQVEEVLRRYPPDEGASGPVFAASPPPPSPTAARATVSDRILSALDEFGSLTRDGVLASLGVDGGRGVSAGSVANALSALRRAGRVDVDEGGAYVRVD